MAKDANARSVINDLVDNTPKELPPGEEAGRLLGLRPELGLQGNIDQQPSPIGNRDEEAGRLLGLRPEENQMSRDAEAGRLLGIIPTGETMKPIVNNIESITESRPVIENRKIELEETSFSGGNNTGTFKGGFSDQSTNAMHGDMSQLMNAESRAT
jgi:hypothetical protein